MTVPEENRPKTTTTDEVVAGEGNEAAKDTSKDSSPGATGRTVREALEEAGVSPEDFEES
ncbi:hypothetical protein [Streptomyces sediminimaris]|uniref:hypothetical protein n=1 Tax=Streptomyces sediminimaris TaxID=3383721 RepID=UPI00399B0A09